MTPANRSGRANRWVGGLGLLAVLVLGVGLGEARRLTYHEAIVAQGARELLASDAAIDWLVPTLGGLPWLEKPPLAHWLVALSSWVAGGVTETSSRLPSALAAATLAGLVAWLAARRFGAIVGLLAGSVQLTTSWSIQRGRLADADMLLALLVAATLLAADRLRTAPDPRSTRAWQWAFFALLGGTSLVKGIGFGAVLAMASLGVLILWDRDRRALLRFCWPTGWCLALGDREPIPRRRLALARTRHRSPRRRASPVRRAADRGLPAHANPPDPTVDPLRPGWCLALTPPDPS